MNAAGAMTAILFFIIDLPIDIGITFGHRRAQDTVARERHLGQATFLVDPIPEAQVE